MLEAILLEEKGSQVEDPVDRVLEVVVRGGLKLEP